MFFMQEDGELRSRPFPLPAHSRLEELALHLMRQLAPNSDNCLA
jgi:hypothetical protein